MSIWLNVAALFAASQGAETLTIEQAVEFATKNAFSVQGQLTVIEKNRQKVRESEGNLGPRVTISGTYTRFDKASTTEIAPGQSIVTQPIDSKSVSAALNLPIDISGNTGRIVRASKASLLASEQTLEAIKSDVKLSVRRAYLNVLRAEEQIEVAQLAIKEAEERLKNAQIEVTAGTKAKIDVIRIEAQLAQAQSELIVANNQRTLAKQLLNNILGRPIETDFSTTRIGALPAAMGSEASDLDKAAQTTRAEAKALVRTQEALAQITKAAERGMNPSLNLGINHVRNIDSEGFSSRDQSTTGNLVLNIPVFDSGITRAQVKQSRQDEEQVKIQLAQVRLGISLEVRQALTSMTNASARLEVAQRQLASAEENYRISRVRLAAGEGITLEITDALTQLTQARSSVVSARYDAWTAFSELQRAVGADDLTQVMRGKN